MGEADIFDYVIVGAGMAGSVLAHGLTADGRTTVCVLEAGPPDRHPYLHVPAGFIKLLFDPTYTWQFRSEPAPGTAGRAIATIQGRTLGGSSAINGLNYVRGQPGDFDSWAQRGNPGWSYAEVLPYFRRSERRVGAADPLYRGSDGLLPITDCDWRHPLCEAFIAGAESLGAPRNPDYNGAQQLGVGYYQRWVHKGWRISAATAFLRPAMRRANLEVRTGAHATGLLFEGRRVVGVAHAAARGAPSRTVRARREVILCAGPANTPKLLQISGIGPGRLLGEIGVEVRHELSGVGENLQDHYMVRPTTRVKGIETINSLARGIRLAGEVGKWLAGRPSILAISPAVAYAFLKSDPALDAPDLQFHFTPGSYMGSIPGLLDRFPGVTLGVYQLRPSSVGHVRARSSDPFDAPRIQPNYLEHESDQRLVVKGLRMSRALLATAPMKPFVVAEENPGPAATSDEDLLDFARRNGNTGYHLMGACRMGPRSDAGAVVDNELRVIGLDGLRVADTSVIPAMLSANLGAAALMIGEKAVDLVLGRPALEAAPVGPPGAADAA